MIYGNNPNDNYDDCCLLQEKKGWRSQFIKKKEKEKKVDKLD